MYLTEFKSRKSQLFQSPIFEMSPLHLTSVTPHVVPRDFRETDTVLSNSHQVGIV